ncbi:retrovirus-related pol polyprotein from transposon TNT 1-94 [Tanacetum coccineum]
MSSMSEDIQCAGSDTRPPMLDRTDFESWQQRIRLYCLGKDNGENIMKSINEGPFHMGTVSDVIAGGTEGAVQQGPVRARVLNDLSAEEKERYKADIRATNILLQGIPKDIYSLINHYTDAKDIWENVKMILEGSESCEPYNAKDVTALIEQNDCVRVELEKRMSSWFTYDYVKQKFLGALNSCPDVKPIPHPLKNNRSAHLNYISHLKESVETVREIVEEARVVKPLRQFCDSDLEVAFRKHTCFVRGIKGTDILKGSRGTNLYTISIDEMMKSSPICFLSKASKSKSWLWHRHLNHLNFGTINDLSQKDLVRGLLRLKFEKDHLCSACQLGKSKKFSHRPKSENTNIEVLHTLHMDLCGPMRVQSIKEKKYILVMWSSESPEY